MAFDQWYIDQFRETLREPLSKSDGMTDAEIESLLQGREIPRAIRDYYRVAGKHWINSNYNQLLPLDAFEQADGYTIFMDENQCVVRWAIRNAELGENDPIVFQGQVLDTGYEWHSEGLSFSRFMIATWRWVLTGEGDW